MVAKKMAVSYTITNTDTGEIFLKGKNPIEDEEKIEDYYSIKGSSSQLATLPKKISLAQEWLIKNTQNAFDIARIIVTHKKFGFMKEGDYQKFLKDYFWAEPLADESLALFEGCKLMMRLIPDRELA